jgi:hypothetical protein
VSSPYFLGFPSLEKLLEQPIVRNTVYVLSLAETSASDHFGRCVLAVHVQAVLVEAIGYVMIQTGAFAEINGHALDGNERDNVTRRTDSALGLIRDFCRDAGFNVVEATFASPKDLKLLNGTAEFLRYDEQFDDFVALSRRRCPTKPETTR